MFKQNIAHIALKFHGRNTHELLLKGYLDKILYELVINYLLLLIVIMFDISTLTRSRLRTKKLKYTYFNV